MKKSDFTTNVFTDYLDSTGLNFDERIDIPLHARMEINSDKWFQFMSDNWHEGYSYETSSRNDATTNQQIRLANAVGYNNANTLKRDWGKDENHRQIFKDFIGDENFKLIGIDPDTVLVRLLCYLPGTTLPLHWDNYEAWQKRFNTSERPMRLSVLVNPYSWGQYLQIHNTMLSNWTPGDTYIIPPNVLHCSGNGGIVPKITLTLTGVPL